LIWIKLRCTRGNWPRFSLIEQGIAERRCPISTSPVPPTTPARCCLGATAPSQHGAIRSCTGSPNARPMATQSQKTMQGDKRTLSAIAAGLMTGGGGQSDRRRGGDLRRHLQRSNSTRHLAATLRAKVFTISSLAWFSNEPTMHCNEATNPAGRDHPIALRPPHRRAAEAVSGARRTCCLCGHEEEGACGGLRKRGSGMATRELALNPFARMTSSIVNKVVPYGICDCHCA